MDLGFTVRILKEDGTFIAHVPELDVPTCGDTEAEASRNIADAVQGFLVTAKEQGTLNDILQEAGYLFEDGRWKAPVLVGVEHMSVGPRSSRFPTRPWFVSSKRRASASHDRAATI